MERKRGGKEWIMRRIFSAGGRERRNGKCVCGYKWRNVCVAKINCVHEKHIGIASFWHTSLPQQNVTLQMKKSELSLELLRHSLSNPLCFCSVRNILLLGLAMNRKNELSDKKHAAPDGERKEKGNLQGESHVYYSSSFFPGSWCRILLLPPPSFSLPPALFACIGWGGDPMQIPELKIRKLKRRSQRDTKKSRYICNWAETLLQQQSKKANNEMGGAVIASYQSAHKRW